MRSLVNSWNDRVRRIANELNQPATRDSWGAHDYFGALYLRSSIEKSQIALDSDQARLVEVHLSPIDELLSAITETDHDELVIRYGEAGLWAVEQWWWHRIPLTGLVREELKEWEARRLERQIPVALMNTYIAHLESEIDEKGFLGLLGYGIFDHASSERFINILRSIEIGTDASISRRLVSLLWHLPITLRSYHSRIEENDAPALETLEGLVLNELIRILGTP